MSTVLLKWADARLIFWQELEKIYETKHHKPIRKDAENFNQITYIWKAKEMHKVKPLTGSTTFQAGFLIIHLIDRCIIKKAK